VGQDSEPAEVSAGNDANKVAVPPFKGLIFQSAFTTYRGDDDNWILFVERQAERARALSLSLFIYTGPFQYHGNGDEYV
jgi:hypothetical protein